MPFHFALPSRLRENFTQPTAQGIDQLRRLLADVYLPSWHSGADLTTWRNSDDWRRELEDHVTHRLEMHRHRFIPWIDSVVRLNNLTILEIGCGTGCATVAMAEQGSTVVALDVHREGLAVSQLRAQVHGLRKASFIHGNAENLEELTRHYQFDLILFHAVLEHMTLKERKAALQAAWGILRKGNYLCISDTPNRLWFFDGHTSRLPFFNWLPDELAFEYSSLSPRLPFNARFRNISDEAMLSFIREGRGFSFHELDLALGDCSRYEVVSDLAEFVSLRYPAVALKRALEREGKRERLLNYYAPDRARGFFRQGINLVMQKLH